MDPDQPPGATGRPLLRATESALEGSGLRNLGAPTGMQRLHVTQGRLDPGGQACELSCGARDEIFLQIIAGSGVLECDDQRVSLATGDLLSLAHPDSVPLLRNTGADPLIWLMGRHRTD